MAVSEGPPVQFTILLSSAGRRVSLLRTLREAVSAAGLDGRVIACDLGWTAPAMHLADGAHIVPRCTDPAFAGRVTELCRDEHVNLVIPTIDAELPVWAALKPELAISGTVVAISDSAAIAIAADKRLTNELCRAAGVPCPRQTSVEELRRSRDGWTLPLVVKPARGSASVGVRMVSTWEEFDRIGGGPDLVVEERAAGVEYTVDLYIGRDGIAYCPVVRRRLEVRAGEVSKSLVVRDSRLAALAVQVVERLPGAYGPLNVQIFSDGDSASVIEINARFGGGYPLTWRAGGRYSEWLVMDAAHGEAPPATSVVDYDLMMLRWDEELIVRAG
jgi:carbamoyl-phosphate synthase large subunit